MGAGFDVGANAFFALPSEVYLITCCAKRLVPAHSLYITILLPQMTLMSLKTLHDSGIYADRQLDAICMFKLLRPFFSGLFGVDRSLPSMLR